VPETRHYREYALREIHLLRRYKLAENLRGEGIYALGRKTGPVRERYPGWLYT
jgi:hypothetical protein